MSAWCSLCPALDDALALRGRVQQEPRLLLDPWNDAQLRWLLIFEPELAAAQTLYSALSRGARLSDEEISPALGCLRTLQETIATAEARLALRAA
jgi:hypothetical protein